MARCRLYPTSNGSLLVTSRDTRSPDFGGGRSFFTWGLADPEEGWDLWASSTIGEAELDQIQTRRGGYGRSPRAFRSLVRVYPAVIALADEIDADRRVFWRQGYLRWLLRLGAFTDFSGMPEMALREDLLALAHEVAATAGTFSRTSE